MHATNKLVPKSQYQKKRRTDLKMSFRGSKLREMKKAKDRLKKKAKGILKKKAKERLKKKDKLKKKGKDRLILKLSPVQKLCTFVEVQHKI